MSNNLKPNLSESIMSEIKIGKMKMKPKWYFVLGSLAMLGGFLGLTVVSIFLVSLITFSLKTHGPMGAVRFEQLVSGFPWWAPIVTVAGIWLGVWLLKKYDFSYKKNFVLIIVYFVLTVLLAGYLISFLGLDNAWMKQGPMRGFYQHYDGGGMMRGSGQRIIGG